MFERRLPQMAAYLEALAHKGFAANTIIDVGACHGTLELIGTFPDAYHIFIEPQSALIPRLERWLKLLDGELHVTALSSKLGKGSMIPSGANASLRHPGSEQVTVQTLDYLFSSRMLPPPILLKTDCQGSDLSILRGGTQLLQKVDVIICETSLLDNHESTDTNVFSATVAFLEKHGFILHDIIGHHQRPFDSRLAQLDLAFLRQDHALAQPQPW